MIRAQMFALVSGLLFLTPAGAQPPSPAQSVPPSREAVDYENDVRPILESRCFGCHGPRQAQSGLRLDLRQNALRGGDYGVVIVPGRSADSKLIQRLIGSSAGLQMPPTGPLPEHEIATLRAWVDAGAEMPGRALDRPLVARETPPALKQLIDAISRHDVAAVRRQLAADRALALSADSSGSTALMHGVALGTLDILQVLLDAGADVNAGNGRQATALHWAVTDPAKVRLLLANGATVDAKATDGRTPLFTAAALPNGAAAVQLLLDAGADVTARTLTGITPLFAAAVNSAETTRLLLDKGADPNAESRSGVRPILQTRDANVVALLIARGADVRVRSKAGETALMDAALRGDLEAATQLLDRGAEVNVADHRGYTPLILAAQFDGEAPALVRLLLARGADPHATAEGETALSLAARRGETEVTTILREVAPEPIPADRLRTAAQHGLDLLVKTSPTFIRKGGCNSCHNQMLPAAAQSFARGRGIAVGEPIEQLDPELSDATADRYLEHAIGGGSGINGLTFELFALTMAGTPADARIHSQIHYIKSQQQPDGSWRAAPAAVAQLSLSRPGVGRPPLTFDDFTPTAFMIRALATYGRSSEAADTRARIEKAQTWLLRADAEHTQELAFRLLGLKWSHADGAYVDAAARAVEALQRPDGGWSQLPTLPSDAYATGMALFALHEAGMPPTHRVYQAGLTYLLSMQASDGTWHVRSRSLEFQPYFESGYPYNRDQWISAAGASYATLAIAAAVEPAGPVNHR